MKKIIFSIVAVCIIGIASITANKIFLARSTYAESLLMENAEALSLMEESTTKCPSYKYVPDHFIVATVSTTSGTCNVDGELTVGEKTVSGNFKKGKTYVVVITTKNCDGIQKGACCNQKDVGVSVKKV